MDIRELSETQRAYIAGITDGEGCISVAVRLKKYITPTIQVCNTDRSLCDWLYSIYGGNIDVRVDKRLERRTTFCWRVAGAKAVRFTRDVRPYLRIKHHQADIVLGIPRFKGPSKNTKPYSMTAKDFAANRDIIRAIRKLNKRGR